MTDRKYLLGLFSIFFITIIFAEENRMLWDFGVVIKKPVQQRTPKEQMQPLLNVDIKPSYQVKALIANPFVPPALISLNDKVYDGLNYLESLDNISLDNIHQVKLMANRLTMQNNYQSVIDMISQIDCSRIDENDCLDLNYSLANAFLYTGRYTEAEDVILTNLAFKMDDRFHFLLAMTYESQGKIKAAQEEYLEFINQFPDSEYKMIALIKARMLGRR